MRGSLTGSLVLVSVLAAGALAVGCGSSTTTTAALTKAEFLKKADAICQKGNNEIQQAGSKEFPRSKGKPSQTQLTTFAIQTIMPNVQRQVSQIRALGAPSGDEAKVNAILTQVQSGIDEAKKDPAVLVSSGPGPFQEANKLAKAYGLTVCGSG